MEIIGWLLICLMWIAIVVWHGKRSYRHGREDGSRISAGDISRTNKRIDEGLMHNHEIEWRLADKEDGSVN
jgi:hypothetical protein